MKIYRAVRPGGRSGNAMSDFQRVRVRAGWQDAGKVGDLLAGPVRDRKGQDWMVVQWDISDDPDMHKATGLELQVTTWETWKAIIK